MAIQIRRSVCCDCLNQNLGSKMTEDMLYLEDGICLMCGRRTRVMSSRQSKQMSQVLNCLVEGPLFWPGGWSRGRLSAGRHSAERYFSG